MKMQTLLSLVLSSTIFVASCATTTKIQVKVLKPAELNIGHVKKVAVFDFDFRGEWDFWKEKKTIGKFLTKTVGKVIGVAKKKEVMQPPDPLNAYPGKEVSERFIAKLLENGNFSVLDREQILKTMAEHKFSVNEEIDENKAAEIGSILGVDAVIIGSGNYSVKDMSQGKSYSKKNKDGSVTKYKKYKAIRKVNAQTGYKVVDVYKSLLIASKTNSVSNCSNEKKIFETCQDYSEDSKEERAFKNLPEWRPIVDRLVNDIIDQSVNQIAPHYVTEKRIIKSGKTPAMKAGLDYAKRELWEDAKQSWESVLVDKSEDCIKDHISATYNLGIYYEINSELDKAEELFDQCYKKSGKSEYLDAKARIQTRKEELKRLQEQQEK